MYAKTCLAPSRLIMRGHSQSARNAPVTPGFGGMRRRITSGGTLNQGGSEPLSATGGLKFTEKQKDDAGEEER